MLLAIAVGSTVFYAAIAWLSLSFAPVSDTTRYPTEGPPLLGVLCFLALNFGLYLCALRIVFRPTFVPDRAAWGVIWTGALIFRVLLTWSHPIQEVDLYRYLWDGVVTRAGVSPYAFSPEDVLSAAEEGTSHPTLRRLVDLSRESPGVADALRRVHFNHLSTIYPPASQAVFVLATEITPRQATLVTRTRVMKTLLVAFDLGTLGLVLRLLRQCQLPLPWCLAYAWCPLVMKEIANSGHLDSIAMFFSMAAFSLFLDGLQSRTPRCLNANICGAGLCLAFAVAAKLYAVVWLPLFAITTVRHLGLRRLAVPALIFLVATTLLLYPMFVQRASAHRGPPESGLVAFLRTWEINDLLFMIVVENLKPSNDEVWFSVLPHHWRAPLVDWLPAQVPAGERPFLATRCATGLLTLLLALVIAVRVSVPPSISSPQFFTDVCRRGFLTVAWFWFLCPTQNPWYWLWGLPLLPFVRGRHWWWVSGFVFAYYLRFWFAQHWADTAVAGTPYVGTDFFDYVVPWIEFGPFLVWHLVKAGAHQDSGGSVENHSGK